MLYQHSYIKWINKSHILHSTSNPLHLNSDTLSDLHISNNVQSKITKLGRLSVTSLTHCDFTSCPMHIVGSVYHKHLTLVSYGRVYGAVIVAMSYSWEVMHISGIHLWNFWWGHQIYLRFIYAYLILMPWNHLKIPYILPQTSVNLTPQSPSEAEISSWPH